MFNCGALTRPRSGAPLEFLNSAVVIFAELAAHCNFSPITPRQELKLERFSSDAYATFELNLLYSDSAADLLQLLMATRLYTPSLTTGKGLKRS